MYIYMYIHIDLRIHMQYHADLPILDMCIPRPTNHEHYFRFDCPASANFAELRVTFSTFWQLAKVTFKRPLILQRSNFFNFWATCTSYV